VPEESVMVVHTRSSVVRIYVKRVHGRSCSLIKTLYSQDFLTGQQSEGLLVIEPHMLERGVSRMASCGRLNMWRYTTPTYLDEEPDTKAILITIFPGQSQMYCVFSILLTNYTACFGERQFVGIKEGLRAIP
jgi:hypothetical protein